MVSKRLENQNVPQQCNFKRSIKKNIQESRGTIDQVHSKMLAEFKETDILGIQVKVMKYELHNGPPLKKSETVKFHAIFNKMHEMYTKYEHDMIEYLLNLGMFLKETQLGDTDTIVTENNTSALRNTVDQPNNFPKSHDNSFKLGQRVSTNESPWGTSIIVGNEDKKGYKYTKFMSNVCNNEALDERCDNELKCNRCGADKLTDIPSSSLVCPECGDSSTYIDCTGVHYNMFTDTTITYVQTYEYKRINHLKDWMSSFQGNETVVISNDIILLVDEEIRKQRIDKRTLKPSHIKAILKKLRLNKYYEHTAAILARVTGNKPVTLPDSTQDDIRRMFIRAEATFKTLPNTGRVNFLSYSYLLHKFMQLVGRDDLCDYFPLLKSRSKLFAQEQIWKQICEKNQWKFNPSM